MIGLFWHTGRSLLLTYLAYLSFIRMGESLVQFETMLNIRTLARRNAEFLCTLIPSRVVQRASSTTVHRGQVLNHCSTHFTSGGAVGAAGRWSEPSNSSSKVSSKVVTGAGENVYTQLELEQHLEDVMVLYCMLPPIETLGPDRKSFRLINDVFSAFDDEVGRFKMFKYHHVFNTYIVASPGAALWNSAYENKVTLNLQP
jgi:hypothetical protein